MFCDDYITTGENTDDSSLKIYQHFIKVISESQTKTINIQNVNDAKSIFAKVLAKFNITDEVEKYSLFVSDTHSEAGKCRSFLALSQNPLA